MPRSRPLAGCRLEPLGRPLGVAPQRHPQSLGDQLGRAGGLDCPPVARIELLERLSLGGGEIGERVEAIAEARIPRRPDARRPFRALAAIALVILRTCARCGCEYEWGAHVMVFAGRAGLTPAEIASLTGGSPDGPCWTAAREAALIRPADALHDSTDIDDDLWRSALEVFNEQQLLDATLLCGWYHAICYAARAARVDLEPGAPRFADATAG